MKRLNWQIVLGIGLLLVSLAVYLLDYLIFGDFYHTMYYMVGDIAFIPIEVFIVTMIIHKLLEAHERRTTMKKLNMVIGSFFSEIGTPLLRRFPEFSENNEKITEELLITPAWPLKQFAAAKKRTKEFRYTINGFKGTIDELKTFLIKKRDFALQLLSNPVLLEHERFTELLWALFHLIEELQHRDSLDNLPQKDQEHLNGDLRRVYDNLVVQWLDYMGHLCTEYPYLYSLAVRTNPFNKDASVILR